MKKNQEDILNQLERESTSDDLVLKKSKLEYQNKEFFNEPLKQEKKEDKLKWITIDMEELPAGKFYPKGTLIKIRPPKVIDIQNYSMMDPFNYQDMMEKIDGLLASCLNITSNANSFDYTFLKEADRVYILLYLRELGLPGTGYHLIQESCPKCTKINEIELSRENTVHKILPGYISNEFDEEQGVFVIEENQKHFFVGLPTIGMRTYMRQLWKEEKKKRNPNQSFFELSPYIFPNKVRLDGDLLQMEKEWEDMEPEDYSILDDLCQDIDLGIDYLEKKCSSCGAEVHTDARFPKGVRSLFSILNRY